MSRWSRGCARAVTVALVTLAAGCGDDGGSIDDCTAGHGCVQPGTALVEGGEMLLERFLVSPGLSGRAEATVRNTFHAFQYGGEFTGAMREATPGTCIEFEHPVTAPVHDIPESADYVDWGEAIVLTGPGLGDGVTIPKVVAGPTPLTDNRPSPVRHHRDGTWIYGGIEWQDSSFQDVEVVPEGEYALDIDHEDSLRFVMPPELEFPLGLGAQDIMVPASAAEAGLELTWPARTEPTFAHGDLVTFVAFAALPAEQEELGPTPLFVCLGEPEEDGVLVVPGDIVDALPPVGIVQAGRYSLYREALEDDEGTLRRFDLFAAWTGLSLYLKGR